MGSLVPPPPRRHDPEILDGRGHDPELLARSLGHVHAVDRWLGGERALRHHLIPLIRRLSGPLTVLDVGTGDGTVLRRVSHWLQERGRPVLALGLDHHPEILAVARSHLPPDGPVRLLRADGLHLPLADDSVDIVLSTLTLHHFPAEQAVRLVAEMARVARGVVLVSDLERSRLNYLGARLLAATVWRRNPITAHDGPLSVLRAFTADELATVGRKAGLRQVRVERHRPFRLVLEGRV